MDDSHKLWDKYIKTKDSKVRDELINRYLPIVRYSADRIVSQLPAHIRSNDREDLYVEGIIGLMDAMDRYDPSRNIKFETFASKRVRGAILDVLRKEDILPKNVREQVKKIEKAYIKVEAELGRSVSDEEIAKELGMTTDEFYDILEKMKGVSILSFEGEILNKKGEKYGFSDIIGDNTNILAEFEQSEAVAKLAEFIDKLEKDERIALETYYWDGLTQKEIGKVLNISESRVCQILSKVIIKLRSSFRKSEQER
ncbi:MAG TPA: FliA/WhiG family RNA polymerase sigma factor [Firmicutes bacterium]|nr:FliA/WhiG family RNA polymerase sigma factor [Bacillota bacterium]